MYKWGHVGLGCLVYSPLCFVLVSSELYVAFALCGVTVQFWALCPDIDRRLAFLDHRGYTHTLFAAVLAGLVTAVVAVALHAVDVVPATVLAGRGLDLSAPELVGGLGFLLGVLGVTSHLLGDLLTPMGIAPVAPVSNATLSLELCKARNRVANAVFLAVGLCALGVALVLGVLSA